MLLLRTWQSLLAGELSNVIFLTVKTMTDTLIQIRNRTRTIRSLNGLRWLKQFWARSPLRSTILVARMHVCLLSLYSLMVCFPWLLREDLFYNLYSAIDVLDKITNNATNQALVSAAFKAVSEAQPGFLTPYAWTATAFLSQVETSCFWYRAPL